MDQQQQQTILQAIAVSALHIPGADRQSAFQVLQDLKKYEHRVALCLQWLHTDTAIVVKLAARNDSSDPPQQYDISMPTKLLALEILDNFLVTGYAQCTEAERLALRQAVLQASHLLAQSTTSNSAATTTTTSTEARILARKLATLLEGLVLRDFPQRWPSLAQDLFASPGGLWSLSADSSNSNSTIGVKICLECFRLLAEDCTDSDFNVKISTQRRNDVLTGLNEIAHTSFLPLFFQLLERYYPLLQQSKQSLHQMHQFLLQGQRTTAQLTPAESTAYQAERSRRNEIILLLSDTINTMEKFCSAMPVDWIVSSTDSASTSSSDNSTSHHHNNPQAQHHNLDFMGALWHLLREPAVQCQALDCLDQLASRGKLDMKPWLRWIRELPVQTAAANQQFQLVEWEMIVTEARATSSSSSLPEALVVQWEYHRRLSRVLASGLASYLGHLTSQKQLFQQQGTGSDDADAVSAYLRLLVELLQHPSGRVSSEQIGMWTSLYRDPQISRSRLLQPWTSDILTGFMGHMVKVNWDDVENEVHPQTKLLDASFDDADDYASWMMDLRSRSSQLFKLIGHTEPSTTAQVLNASVKRILSSPSMIALQPPTHQSHQLSMDSEQVVQLEALVQPLENSLGGMPTWARQPAPSADDPQRERQRVETRTALTELCLALVVRWKPTHVWLQFRHASLMEALRHYWKHDPASSLLPAVDTLIRYLGLGDEWHNPTAGLNAGTSTSSSNTQMSDEIVGLKKRSGTALVSVAKSVPHHLVPWLSQLSEATRSLLASPGLIPMNQMHLYEFLSCVATAVENPQDRSNFIADVLAGALATLKSDEIQRAIQTPSSLLAAFGVTQAAERPESVTEPGNVARVQQFYRTFFTSLNQLLSVGRRCSEAARKKSILGGLSFTKIPLSQNPDFGEPGQPSFPSDEGSLSLQDLAINDPFTPLWPRILPTVLQVYEVTLGVWRPEFQAALLQNSYQRYIFAITDDEAYTAKNQSFKSSGGVFGEGGTAGSVVSGTDRRDINLVPKWAGWFNELRNTCFQLLGLLAGQRVLYAPEISSLFPRVVAVLTDPLNLKSMEHRHLTQYLKHVIEILLLSCPCSLYKTHLEPIVGPFMDHMRYRLDKTWLPVLSTGSTSGSGSAVMTKALTSADCANVALIASRGEEEWFSWYYAHAGLFVGDLDSVTSEAAVEKHRVDISRAFSDVLQSALALKGDWALVLANQAREEQALKKNDSSILTSGPANRVYTDGTVAVNADGTPKHAHQAAIDARKLLRINGLCHFLLLESESIAGNLTLAVIQCLGYPDAYTCRRIVKICHRVLETVAWSPHYSQLLGQQMFTQTVKNLVTEPKWMVGIEWDMINVVRDIYCRLVLGQIFQAGGQGIGQQQPDGQNGCRYEQAKTADKPLQGGGILVQTYDVPRQLLASLPGIGATGVREFEHSMTTKRSAKDQKDCIRDLLRVAADNLQAINPATDDGSAAASIFDRAVQEESLLHGHIKAKIVQDLPEKLVTHSQVRKAREKQNVQEPVAGASWLFD